MGIRLKYQEEILSHPDNVFAGYKTSSKVYAKAKSPGVFPVHYQKEESIVLTPFENGQQVTGGNLGRNLMDMPLHHCPILL